MQVYIAVYNVYIGKTSVGVSSPSRIIILFVLVLSLLGDTCRVVVVSHPGRCGPGDGAQVCSVAGVRDDMAPEVKACNDECVARGAWRQVCRDVYV